MKKRPPHQPPFGVGSEYAVRNGGKGGQVGKAKRSATAPRSENIIEFMDAVPDLKRPSTVAWWSFNKAIHGHRSEMSDQELEIACACTRLEPNQLPLQQAAEAFLIKGRGAGGTLYAEALNATHRAVTFDASGVAVGEPVTIPIISVDQKSARQAFGYVRGFCELPLLKPYVHRVLSNIIEFKTGVNIEIMTASFRTLRGYTMPAAFPDESAFYFVDGANADAEILTALRGALGRVPGSLLLVLSSPYAPRGELYEAYRQYFGRPNEDVLVWNAATRTMNPTYGRKHIEREYKRDPVAAASEYGPPDGGHVEFRQAQQALFDQDSVDAAVTGDRRELLPVADTSYVAFIDAAEGSRSGDSMTLGIAHREGARAVLDLLREVEPPFNPGQVIASAFAPICKQYGCRTVTGDRHAIGFVAEYFAACAIKFVATKLTKSDIFAELLPLVNTGAVELLDHPTLRTQLLALERRSVRGGRDSIDHPRGGHDDIANSAAGCLVLASGVTGKKKRRAVFGFEGSAPVITGGDQHAAMRELIALTKQRVEEQAELEWEVSEAFRRRPPVWYVPTY